MCFPDHKYEKFGIRVQTLRGSEMICGSEVPCFLASSKRLRSLVIYKTGNNVEMKTAK
jgi:hypothetical protein